MIEFDNTSDETTNQKANPSDEEIHVITRANTNVPPIMGPPGPGGRKLGLTQLRSPLSSWT